MAALFGGGGDDIAIAGIGRNGEAVAYMYVFIYYIQLQYNTNISYRRCIGSIAGGSIAGILGLTGIYGALFYGVVMLSISAAILLKTNVQPDRYFFSPWSTIFVGGIFDRNILLSYLLFWTFFYAFR